MNYLTDSIKREEISFNTGWYFCHTKDNAYDEKEEREVKLPHDWSLEYPFYENAASCGSGGYVETGIGYYRKRFSIDKDIAEKKDIYIRFEGVYMSANVWINGTHVKNHIYGYTPFSINITEYLKKDGSENEIRVRVDNSAQPNSRWYSGSGITRDVWLIALSKSHIEEYGVWVRAKEITKDRAVMSVNVRAEGELTDAHFLKIEMYENILNGSDTKSTEADNRLVYSSDRIRLSDKEATVGFDIENPHKWDINDPFMYTVRIGLYDDITLIDETDTYTGLRTLSFDKDKGFSLNNRHVKLNGVCVHHDGGSVGAAVPTVVWERRLRILKEMGANAVRMAHNPPNKEVLDICDRIGLMVMDEAFDEWGYLKSKDLGSNTSESRGYSEYYKECHEEDLSTMLKRDRNHPSIVIWSIGNEVPDQTAEDGKKTVEHLKSICRKLDPDRLITQANDNIEAEPRKAKDEFLDALDVVGYNYVGRWRKRAETLYGEDKIKHPDRCVIGTENTGIGGVRDEYQTEVLEHAGWRTYPYFHTPVLVGRLLRYTMVHDYVSGDFMWTGIDYLGEAHWPTRSSTSGVLDTCGYKKDSFYFYQSIWRNDITVVHLMPHWNIKAKKGDIVKVLGFSNCETCELFLNGRSFGKKAKSYPDYGMTERYGHYDRDPVLVCTDDMFLSWDVPYEEGVIELVGYKDGKEAGRHTVRTTDKAESVKIEEYIPQTGSLESLRYGRNIMQAEISLLDKNGDVSIDSMDEIEIEHDGKLLGIDSGDPKNHESMREDHIHAFHGRAFVILEDATYLKARITGR